MGQIVEHTLRLGGVKTRALELEGEGPPLILLHGFADSADTWRPLLDRLRKVVKDADWLIDVARHAASCRSCMTMLRSSPCRSFGCLHPQDRHILFLLRQIFPYSHVTPAGMAVRITSVLAGIAAALQPL